MASCALTQDIIFGCDTGSGGIAKEMYLIELENVSSYTESSGSLSGITKAAGKVFRKYQLVQETATFEEDIVGNRINGTLYYDQKGTIIFNKQALAIRNEILLLARNRLVAIVQDNNGAWKLYGRVFGLMLQTGSAATGTAWGDRNGYTLNLTGKETELAPFVSSSVITGLQS